MMDISQPNLGMPHRIHRPEVFRRDDLAEENYLVVMYYLASMLWDQGCAVEAMASLSTLAKRVSEHPSA